MRRPSLARSALRILRILVVAGVVLAFGAPPLEALARPGGGQTFGGKSDADNGKSTSGSRSSGKSPHPSYGGVRTPSDRDKPSESWSERPSYSAPWTQRKPEPSSRNPWSARTSKKPAPASGSLFEFFFYLFVGGGVVFAGIAVFVVREGAREIGYAVGRLMDRTGESEPSPPPSDDDAEAPRAQMEPRHLSIQAAIDSIRGDDEDFSFVVFEDFLHSLYTEVHTARGKQALELLEPYVTDDVLRGLASPSIEGVRDIVVGAMTIESVKTDASSRRIEVAAAFTANYTELLGPGEQSFYVAERWTLSKSADRHSRPPERARVVGCPGCGAALDKLVASKCRYCGQTTKDADLDWRIDRIEVTEKEIRGPMLRGTTEERGTSEPTKVAPDAQAGFDAIVARDPAFDFGRFVARVERVFATFHAAWNARDLAAVRPYLTDGLFDTQRYWIAAYEAQGLRNTTENAIVMTVHLSKVRSDRHYDAITVRVFASCLDYTVDEGGAVVSGTKETPRAYSEYWTFIRARATKGAPKTDPGCPSCGAPIERINMAGKCESCNVEVTRGQFDWVLSRIEQDEVYEV